MHWSYVLLKDQIKINLRLPHLLQNENVTQWEWWVFLKNLEDLPLSNINWYLAGEYEIEWICQFFKPYQKSI